MRKITRVTRTSIKESVGFVSSDMFAVESRNDKRPLLSDLRETGQIEQDADIIMLMYREDYYDLETEHKDLTEIHVAKHRNGPVGVVKLRFLKEYGRFVE